MSATLGPRSMRHRSGLDLARLNRRRKERNRREFLSGLLLLFFMALLGYVSFLALCALIATWMQ